MSAAYELLIAALGSSACWALWFYLYKEYRVSALRDDLFALREELFLLAADGNLDFNDPSYQELRQRLNAMIRFAHRISLPTLIFVTQMARHNTERDISYAKWVESVKRLPPDTQKQLTMIHYRMLLRFTKHLVKGSISLTILFVFVNAALILRSWTRQFFTVKVTEPDPTNQALSELVVTLHVSTLEKKAYEERLHSEDLDLQLV